MGYGSIVEVKSKIMKEETINNIGKPEKEKNPKESKDAEICVRTVGILCAKERMNIKSLGVVVRFGA